MHDDDFERSLAQRLRAYESRLPDSDAPDPATMVRRRGLSWPAALGTGTAVLAGALVALFLINQPEGRVGESIPSASASASASTVPSREPSERSPAAASATVEPTEGAPSAELGVSRIASFVGDGGPSMVEDIVRTESGLVAIGISYRGALPNVGPTPLHRARIWISSDGRSWTDVTLGDAFDNVSLDEIVVRADGSLLVVGYVGHPGETGIEETEPGAWTSVDGFNWVETDSGLPRTPVELVQGAQGYLALLPPDNGVGQQELWHSADGSQWALVRSLNSGFVRIGAGDEGFVAVGRVDGTGDGEPFGIASGDGIEWFEASTPPAYAAVVAPLGPDWIALTGFSTAVRGGTAWFSADGLEWVERGSAPLAERDDASGSCGEYPGALSVAGSWLILDGEREYPCSEGGYLIHGTQWASRDGEVWMQLPFAPGTPGESRTGTSVQDAVELGGDLVLVGEEDGEATFWLAESP
jgi:hypothetical protein